MIENKEVPFATWLKNNGFTFSNQYSDKRDGWRRVKFFKVQNTSFHSHDDYEISWPLLQQEAIRYYKTKHPDAVITARMIREAKHDGDVYSIIIEIV